MSAPDRLTRRLSLAASALSLLACSTLTNLGGASPADDASLADLDAWVFGGVDVNQNPVAGSFKIGADEITTGVDVELAWVWATLKTADYTGVTVSVDVSETSGNQEAGIGVICNYRDDSNFAYASIDMSGRYTIAVFEADIYSSLAEPVWDQAAGVDPALSEHRLEVTCANDEISLTVDGIQVDTEAAPSGGRVGLILETFSDPVSTGTFRNLEIRTAGR
jgi:hypothetical protein